MDLKPTGSLEAPDKTEGLRQAILSQVRNTVVDVARRHGLWLIEDNCDARGSTYKGRFTGTFGDLATFSFYPAHHITMGEGGCVVTSQPRLKTVVESFRDWGRDCWCVPGQANTCGKRFDWQVGGLPYGTITNTFTPTLGTT